MMNNIIVRKAKLKDVPIITEFGIELLKYHQKFDPYFAPVKDIKNVYSNYFRKCVYSRNNILLVAENEGKVIGYALGALGSRPPVFEIRKVGNVNDMFVIEKYRKKGVAQKFLDELFSWFNKKELSLIELSVHSKNEIGKKAWAKYGFEGYLIKMKTRLKS